MNDPTGTTQTMTDASGALVGSVVYDAFGGVLQNTIPAELTSVYAELPDAASGLVHVGGGRWYDPMIGRPLQPNPAGGAPTAPQTISRYTATSFGQPGVYAAATKSGLPPIIGATGSNAISAGAGIAISKYANSGLVGDLLIQANESLLSRAGYSSLFNKVMASGRGHSAYYLSNAVRQLDDGTFQALGSNGANIDLAHLESKVISSRWPVGYPAGEAFDAFDDNIWKQLLRNGFGEIAAGTLVNAALSFNELVSPWENPYFSREQRLVQSGITLLGAGVSSWATYLAAGTVTGTLPTMIVVTVTGVAVYWAWDHGVKPAVSWIAVNLFERTDPYQMNRTLKPLKDN